MLVKFLHNCAVMPRPRSDPLPPLDTFMAFKLSASRAGAGRLDSADNGADIETSGSGKCA